MNQNLYAVRHDWNDSTDICWGFHDRPTGVVVRWYGSTDHSWWFKSANDRSVTDKTLPDGRVLRIDFNTERVTEVTKSD